MKQKPMLSVVVPVFNEAAGLPWLHQRITEALQPLPVTYEVIYVDDGSTDNSFEVIRTLATESPSVQYVAFSRNFGKEAATTAGLHKAKGDAAVIMDADGQHPPETIKSFLTEWEKGFQVVIGVRQSNKGEGAIKKYGSILFYKLFNFLTSASTKPASTDFRLIDRKVIDAFNTLTERGRITRGLIDWLGFKRCYVEFHAPKRQYGKATYSYKKLIILALHAFVSSSTKPLKAVGVLGFLVTIGSILLGGILLIEKYALHDPLNLAVSGSAILAIFLSFLVGIVLTCQGLLALYIESIHNETQNRPLFVISEESN